MSVKKMWKVYEVIETRGNVVLDPKPEFEYNSLSGFPCKTFEAAEEEIKCLSCWDEDKGRVLTILPLYVLEEDE